MNQNEAEDFIYQVLDNMPTFINNMYLGSGKFKYTYSSDIVSPQNGYFGLGATVFASKIGFMSNNKLVIDELNNIDNFLKTFKKSNNSYSEQFIKDNSKWARLKTSIKNMNPKAYSNRKSELAETRQTYAVLSAFKILDKNVFKISKQLTTNFVDNYFSNLNFSNPWDANSHISHLSFFLNIYLESKIINIDEYNLIKDAILNNLKNLQANDGYVYKGNPKKQFKINGMMKMFLSLNSLNDFNIVKGYEKELIDDILQHQEGSHGCDLFNVIWVLYNLSLITDYKRELIISYSLNLLFEYKKYYNFKNKGFSFSPNNCAVGFYGAKMANPSNEADIHGTSLFLWGLTVISKILRLKKCNLKLPIA